MYNLGAIVTKLTKAMPSQHTMPPFLFSSLLLQNKLEHEYVFSYPLFLSQVFTCVLTIRTCFFKFISHISSSVVSVWSRPHGTSLAEPGSWYMVFTRKAKHKGPAFKMWLKFFSKRERQATFHFFTGMCSIPRKSKHALFSSPDSFFHSLYSNQAK